MGKAAREMVLQNIAFLADSYLACPEYESVLLCWAIPEERIFQEILGRMKQPCREHRFALLPREDVLVARLERDIREGRRESGAVERSRSRYPAFLAMNTAKVDVSDCSPAQAAQEIFRMFSLQNRENG